MPYIYLKGRKDMFYLMTHIIHFIYEYNAVGHMVKDHSDSLLHGINLIREELLLLIGKSSLHGVDPLSYFSFQPVLHDWCNKGCVMCYPVCGMVYIKEPLLLIGKSSPCGGSRFPLSLFEWSFTICLTPYNRK